MPRFNIGDRVRVARRVRSGDWGIWAHHMSALIGQEFVVERYSGRLGGEYQEGDIVTTYRLRGRVMTYWPEEALELVEAVDNAPVIEAPPRERFCVAFKRNSETVVRMLLQIFDSYPEACARTNYPVGQRDCVYYIIPLRAVAESSHPAGLVEYT